MRERTPRSYIHTLWCRECLHRVPLPWLRMLIAFTIHSGMHLLVPLSSSTGPYHHLKWFIGVTMWSSTVFSSENKQERGKKKREFSMRRVEWIAKFSVSSLSFRDCWFYWQYGPDFDDSNLNKILFHGGVIWICFLIKFILFFSGFLFIEKVFVKSSLSFFFFMTDVVSPC